MTFGKRIKELRKEQKLTLEQLAEKSGLSVMTLSKLENETHLPGALTIGKLATALNANFDELWDLAYRK